MVYSDKAHLKSALKLILKVRLNVDVNSGANFMERGGGMTAFYLRRPQPFSQDLDTKPEAQIH